MAEEIEGIDLYNFKDDDGNTYKIRDGRFISEKDSTTTIYPLVKMIRGSDYIDVEALLSDENVPLYTIKTKNIDNTLRTCNSISIDKDDTSRQDKNFLVVKCDNDTNTYYLRIDEHGLSASRQNDYNDSLSKQLLYANNPASMDSILLKNILNIYSKYITATGELKSSKILTIEDSDNILASIDANGELKAKGYYLNDIENAIRSINLDDFSISDGLLSLVTPFNS